MTARKNRAAPPPNGPTSEWTHFGRLFRDYLSLEGFWGVKIQPAVNAAQQKSPETLWHYCPLIALENIAKSQRIFLTDLNSMNDYKEGRWIKDRIMSKIMSGSPACKDFARYIVSTEIGFQLDPFVLSLSSEGDILSQWRAYANGGRGVALGFETNRMRVPTFVYDKQQMPGQIVLANVVYDTVVQDIIVDLVYDLIRALISDCEGHDFSEQSHPYLPCAAYLNMYLHYLAPFFKNPAFEEEKEWRLIFYPKSWLRNTHETDVSALSLETDQTDETMAFRFREDDIIPYFTFPNKSSNIMEMVHRVMLGPLCRMNRKQVALFLKLHGGFDFSIETSRASLR